MILFPNHPYFSNYLYRPLVQEANKLTATQLDERIRNQYINFEKNKKLPEALPLNNRVIFTVSQMFKNKLYFFIKRIIHFIKYFFWENKEEVKQNIQLVGESLHRIQLEDNLNREQKKKKVSPKGVKEDNAPNIPIKKAVEVPIGKAAAPLEIKIEEHFDIKKLGKTPTLPVGLNEENEEIVELINDFIEDYNRITQDNLSLVIDNFIPALFRCYLIKNCLEDTLFAFFTLEASFNLLIDRTQEQLKPKLVAAYNIQKEKFFIDLKNHYEADITYGIVLKYESSFPGLKDWIFKLFPQPLLNEDILKKFQTKLSEGEEKSFLCEQLHHMAPYKRKAFLNQIFDLIATNEPIKKIIALALQELNDTSTANYFDRYLRYARVKRTFGL